MKLKYYLKGLGTGILAAALVFAAAGGSKPPVMSDSEILARAAQLESLNGDTLEEAGEDRTRQETESEQDTEAEQDGSAAVAEETVPGTVKEAEETPEISEQEPAEGESGTLSEPEAGQTAPDGGQEKPQAGSGPETEAEPERPDAEDDSRSGGEPEEVQEQEVVVITVNRGDSSETVSRKVAEAGLVPSAEEYNRFLCGGGYDKKLNVGKHEIPAGASETEIARLLTGR